MSVKLDYYAGMAEYAACRVTSSRERWTSFLATAAWLNRYPYNEQLMIHAQRPDATACAEYDLWNVKMNRYVKRGSKGIALLDYSREKPRLRYVFDISDTGTRSNSRDVNLWKMQDEHREFVQGALEHAFDVSAHGTSFEIQVENIAKQLVAEYWEENKRYFFDIVENSFLEEYDELNIEMAFRNAATVSITYAIYSRCVENHNEYFALDDFAYVFDFNTRQAANALGTAVSEISAKVFREIERSIRNYERNKQAERSNDHDGRNDLQAGGGLSDPGHQTDPHRGEAVGQIRENEKGIPSGEQQTAVQRPASQREAVPPSVGDRRNSEPQDGTVDEPVSVEQSGTRQGNTADGLGSAHEHIEDASRGSDNGGAYQQLNVDFYATEQEQIGFIDRVESGQQPSTFSFTQNEIVKEEAEERFVVTETAWNYRVGDTVYLDDTAFLIEQIRNHEVVMRDPALSYPISRVEGRENFERILEQDNRNSRYKDGYVSMVADDAEEQEVIPAYNYHITNDALGEGGSKLKFTRNIDAIKMLFELEGQKRSATPEEQEILASYVGWGGLADAFDPNKSGWTQEYQTLKSLFSEEEYAAARASTLNAHYTSPTVIRAIYDAVGRMGFETGNILEPSMGVGNFFGMLPPEMQRSRLYGVELDSITGRIAQKLYPNAEIKVAGFETTDRRDFYDLAVGNVPFGNYKVSDKPYDKLGFSIHNYFFAKALDQVRPGGVVAFVTSRYTMDSKNADARKYIAQRAELLGAIRLPNDAFKKNAGTEVVSDIIFLQKRDSPIDIVPDWVYLGQADNGLSMNQYFLNHPEMVLGEIAKESTSYGKDDLTVKPYEGKGLAELLKDAVTNIKGSYQAVELAEADEPGMKQDIIPADPNVKNYSYAVVDGEVYFRENSIMQRCDLNEKAKERVCGMVGLRQIVNELIAYQLDDFPDGMIRSKQKELDSAYDAFTAKNGLINARANGQAFSDDSSYYLLCSLENVDEDGKLISKADMFTKRTIKPERRVTSVDTPSEALAISIGERGKVDLPYMADLLGTPDEYETIISELRGIIFKDPMSPGDTIKGWMTADEYLSGDVRSKLHIAQMAQKNNPDFAVNVQALEQAQPKDLEASEIEVRLGATWIKPDYIQEFMEDTFETPHYLRWGIKVKYSEITAEWQISGKSTLSDNDVAAYVTYGTGRANAYRILEETLNLKDIRIYDTVEDAEGKQKRVFNKTETTLAQQKQQAIKDAFANWVWKDPERREQLVTRYNELFNSTRPREFDGSHIRFGGMNPDIILREHQKNAIAHVLYGGNTLLAHEVGAGKTFEMAASAMESKRLGLCQKSMFVVPNHLTMQWANEFLHLYPSAKLLVATKKDFETANRKKFCARIATGDFDAVIIGHSQFERIPISTERQERQLREQIDEIEGAIAELKYQRGENFTIKQMEKTRKSLEARLDKLLNSACFILS